jgi:FKBP-type peptidyl-prolyl cis-trans isomerase
MSRGAKKTEGGLVLVPIRAGNGAVPGPNSRITVLYEGKLIDGTVFNSVLKRDQPATFGMDGVIPCWSQALPLMKVGEKARVVCPSELAYGTRGAPPKVGPNALLDFEVELLAVDSPESPGPAAPGRR